jgi:pimeloyl-ACP methyl ester carboxylesterase
LSPHEILDAILAGRFQSSTISTCLENLDADPVFYTSSEIVDDLDAVRSALGYEQFNLVGISYGSRLALGYLHRYPMRIRTIALRGVASPAGNQLSDIGSASEEAIERLFDRCSKDPGCESEYPDLEQTFRRVLSRLEREPPRIDVEQRDGKSLSLTISRDLFAGAVRFALYSDRSARTVPRLISDADRGRWSSLASSLATYLGPGLASSLSFGSYLSIVCAEDIPFFDLASTTRSTGPFFLTTSVIENHAEVCTLWPHRVVSADLKEPVSSHVPSLLMSGSEDPATSAASANEIGRLLEKSRHLVTPGLAHFPVWTDCFVTNVARLIRSGSTDAVDGSCVEDYAASRPSSRAQ